MLPHRTALLLVGWALVWLIGGALLLQPILGLFPDSGGAAALTTSVLGMSGTGLLLAEVVRRTEGWSSASTWGLRRPPAGLPLWIAVLLGTVAWGFVGSWVGALVWEVVQEWTDLFSQPHLELIAGPLLEGPVPQRILWATVIVVLGPVLEELIFRGFLWRGLGGGEHPLRALVLTSLFFSLFHVHPEQASGILPLALFLGLLRWWGGLGAPLLAHIVNNGLSVLFFLSGDQEVAGSWALIVSLFVGTGAAALVASRRPPALQRAPAGEATPALLE